MVNENNITIICSLPDPASVNIVEKLRFMRNWRPVENNCFKAFRFKRFTIVEIEGHHIYQDDLDTRLEECGIGSNLIIFASRHSGKDGRKILTVHTTGNVNEAKFGGRACELAVPAPYAIRNLIRSLKSMCKDSSFEATLEATHHGPSNLHTKSLFIEIGSTRTEWRNDTAGKIVADAILMLHQDEVPVAVGFGGGHYVSRQTKLVCEAGIAFGHIFPNHQLPLLDRDLVKQAFLKSGADFAYFDRKAMKDDVRRNLAGIIHHLGYDVLRESDIREMAGLPFEMYTQFQQKVKKLCTNCKIRFTETIEQELKSACKDHIPAIMFSKIDPELLSMAERVDRNRIEKLIERESIAYLEDENGRFSHILISLTDECARRVAEMLTLECINIIKENYQVRFDADKSQLAVTVRRFSPQRAEELGISRGPLFGKLARGKEVIINGKTIIPDMVYESIEKIIKLKNPRI
ncbi:MAG: D-aminoacyl-tRNA deacylase [Candidatus Argoarchaeum ethanivorans]|uniref:D-aminoacyl-tRNA deacylase n=1 Tax=Candidatus Argoarchaeum ethanivorans TaxID=2608793 RepID=A0A811TC43_9EURY|nr:MAG: D-aminoacyl-tRNA deacylase [Candidatus Argoarchaeum ethanivorans]